MQKLKVWWASLNWWKKALLIIPAAIVALVVCIATLLPRKRSTAVYVPPISIPPTKGAKTVEVKVDEVIEGINEDIRIAKERAKNAEEEIKKAGSFDAVDAALYERRKDGKRD